MNKFYLLIYKLNLKGSLYGSSNRIMASWDIYYLIDEPIISNSTADLLK